MDRSAQYVGRILGRHSLFAIVVAVLGFAIIVRNIGLYPTVFADEYTYSMLSRIVGPADAHVPSYLFIYLFGFSSYCGAGFLECVRIANTVLFLISSVFIYIIASQICDRSIAYLLTILSVALPINTYTAYFMPESLYYLLFWIFSWSIIRIERSDDHIGWVSSAIVFSIASLVKPHILFFLPAVLIYIGYMTQTSSVRLWASQWLWVSTLFVSVGLAGKLLLGFALAGKAGVTLFGTTYGSIAGDATGSLERALDLIRLAGLNLAGHILALFALFGTALIILLVSARSVLFRFEKTDASARVFLYTILTFGTLIPVTALFTASVVGFGPYESPFRLHMRYYNFALPLLFMIVAARYSLATFTFGSAALFVAAVPAAIAIIYVSVTFLSPYTTSLVDNPELRSVMMNRAIFLALMLVGILSVTYLIFDVRRGCAIFLFVFSPIFATSGFYFGSSELRLRINPDIFDRAGVFVRNYLDDSRTELAVMGANPAGLFRTLFYIDDPQAVLIDIPDGAPADLSRVPSDKEWLLLIGDHTPPPASRFKLSKPGFSLIRLGESDVIDFRRSTWTGILSSVQGLSWAEPWGRWSDGAEVNLMFETPLPRNFDVRLTASAFGPNVGQTFKMQIGTHSSDFVLRDSPQEIVIPFRNLKAEASVWISVPEPTSPQELGLSDDPRKLGIALHLLEVEEARQ